MARGFLFHVEYSMYLLSNGGLRGGQSRAETRKVGDDRRGWGVAGVKFHLSITIGISMPKKKIETPIEPEIYMQ